MTSLSCAFLDLPKTESVVEGEVKETDNSEETGVSKLPNKDEVETPELKVNLAFSLRSHKCTFVGAYQHVFSMLKM